MARNLTVYLQRNLTRFLIGYNKRRKHITYDKSDKDHKIFLYFLAYLFKKYYLNKLNGYE